MGTNVSIRSSSTAKDANICRMMKLTDERQIIKRRAGVVWKNLKVCGSGSAISLQQTVGSPFLTPFRLGEVFSKGPEKTILNEFNGLLKTGEMLVVLGRPGSGCKSDFSQTEAMFMQANFEIVIVRLDPS